MVEQNFWLIKERNRNDVTVQGFIIDYLPAAGRAGQGMRFGADCDDTHLLRMDSRCDRRPCDPEQGLQTHLSDLSDLSDIPYQQQPHALRVLKEISFFIKAYYPIVRDSNGLRAARSLTCFYALSSKGRFLMTFLVKAAMFVHHWDGSL